LCFTDSQINSKIVIVGIVPVTKKMVYSGIVRVWGK
jgi:hypothetical protein